MAKLTKYSRYKQKTKKFKRYKNIPTQYFKVKVEYNDKIVFPILTDPFTDDAANEGGPAFFFSKRGVNIVANRSVVNLQEILEGYTYNNVLNGLFSYYKLTGIKVECVPDARNTTLVSSIEKDNIERPVFFPDVMLSYRSGSSEKQTLTEVKANNQSMLLNSLQKTSRYWRVYGANSSYTRTGQYFAGAFTVANSYPSDQSAGSKDVRRSTIYAFQPSWTLKINIYYLYKFSKA